MGETPEHPPLTVTPPPGNPRFPLFDGLRGIAVLLVLVFHASELTGRFGFGLGGRFAEVAGSEGVLVFFGISGFVLYRPYVAARVSGRTAPTPRDYARRRLARIIPAYWTALTLLAVYPGLHGVFSGDWWRYYGFLQIYSARTQGLGLAVAWSLCVEVSFYLILPFWATLAHRCGAAVARRSGLGVAAIDAGALATIAVAGCLVQAASISGRIGSQLGDSILGECTWLSIGMIIAIVSVAREHASDQPATGGRRRVRGVRATPRVITALPGLCWLAAAGCYAALMALVPNGGLFALILAVRDHQRASTALLRIGLEIVVTGALLSSAAFATKRRSVPGSVLTARPLAELGVISYAFYLWHLPIAELIAGGAHAPGITQPGWNLLAHIHTARTCVLVIATTALTGLVAWLSYRLVERPVLTLAHPRRERDDTRPHMLGPR